MAVVNETVMQFIERELEKDPGVSNATLFEGAKEIDGSIAELAPRQFHARYPLQIKRRKAMASAPAPKPAPAPAAPDIAVQEGEDVMSFVERAMADHPDITNAELFQLACEIDSSIADLNRRQFHARYPLQIKRRQAREAARAAEEAAAAARAEAPEPEPTPEPEPVVAEPEPTPEPAPDPEPEPTGDPRAVRGLLLDFARDLVRASGKAETIEVMARLDDYVADIMEAAGG